MMVTNKEEETAVKKFFKPDRNTFFADRIEGLTVSRNRGFEANHKGGREKHSFIWVENGALLFRFSERKRTRDKN